MNAFKTGFRFLYSIYAFILFLTGMILIVPFVVIASFFGKISGGNMICAICRAWADGWMLLAGIFHKNIYESPYDPRKTYIFVANHISYLDIVAFYKTIRHQPFRALGKAEMQKIPIFGFIYKKGAVMVDRSSATRRSQSVRDLKKLLKKHISVCIFPEGTFNETGKPLKDFYDGAFRIAIETKTPIRPVLFLDNYERYHYNSIFSLNPGRSRAVFLEEISPDAYSLKEVALFKRKVYEAMEKKLIEYKANWIR